MNEKVISARGLTKTFGSKTAVDNLSIDIEGEAIIGLIGRNGAGKTTLMKLLAGRHEVNDGELLVFGAPPMDNLAVLQNIVYTYHNMQYEKNLRLQKIINNYAAMFPRFDAEFAVKLLDFFKLNPKTLYRSLSQGMASIFNFICGLSCRADLTLLDEPVLGMDITVRKAAYEVLLREFSEHPRTIIISSHLLAELEGLLSDIILVDNGKLLLYQNIDELRQSAYRIEGDAAVVEAFVKDKNVIRHKSALTPSAVIYEPLTDEVCTMARQCNLKLSAVRPEELYVCLTGSDKEEELECLWK